MQGQTPIRQFASCVLVDIDDTLDGIFSRICYWQIRRTTCWYGINAGRIRGINSKIRGEVQHTGVPFSKNLSNCQMLHSERHPRGSATVHFPIWHQEIQDILVLKNNKGTEDNRVRKLDYSIQLSELFYQRFIDNKNHAFFPMIANLYESFGDFF